MRCFKCGAITDEDTYGCNKCPSKKITAENTALREKLENDVLAESEGKKGGEPDGQG